MKRKTIDASREARLWVCQVIIPAVSMSMMIMQIPGVKESIAEKIAAKREAIKNKFNKH